MDDTPEAIALRLRDFIQAVQTKANTVGFQTRVGELKSIADKAPILQTYEACLSKLTGEERGALDRMIQKMSGAVGSPRGAIIPQ